MSNPTKTGYGKSYLDFTEVWQYLQFPGSPGVQQQNMLQRYIDSACSFAQGAQGANRPIAPTEFRERHDGWAGDTIMLHHSPFLSLVACTEWQSSGGSITLVESTPESPGEGIQIDYATSQIVRVFAGYSWPKPFFPGSRNIEVVYIAGFDPVPPELWEATVDLVGWKWRNSQQASRSVGPQPLGATSFESAGQNPYAPGCPPDIQAVFQSFALPTIG